MTALIATCLLLAGVPDGCGVPSAVPATCLLITSRGDERGGVQSPMPDVSPRSATAKPPVAALYVGVQRSGRAPNQRARDSIWNGILIGAALGIVAIVTTAAEAPPSGKATTVVMIAALGGYVDSRLAVARPFRPDTIGKGRRIGVRMSIRF